jgi:hypothetical protein
LRRIVSMSVTRRFLVSVMFGLLAVFSFHSAKAISARPMASGSTRTSMAAAPEKEDDEKGEKEDDDEKDEDKDEKLEFRI